MPHRLTAREVTKVLSGNGFVMVSQKGSHQKWYNPVTGATTIVSHHSNNKLPIGTI